MVQDFTNLQQLLKIDTLTLEQLIYIRFLTINLFGQPNHRTALTAQLVLDHLTDVKVFHLKLHVRFILKLSRKDKMAEKAPKQIDKKENQIISK